MLALLCAACAWYKMGRSSSGEGAHTDADKIADLEIPVVKKALPGQIIRHEGYTVCFNEANRLPNWVAYELTDHEAQGTVPRAKHFEEDPQVVGAQASNDDYRNSHWDRGHMAPADHMKWSEKAMDESFYFTNVCPQNHNLNGGVWKSLEEKCKDFATRYGSLYVACGPIVGGDKNGTIGKSGVVVPDAFYKVLLVCDKGSYRAIGFLFENVAGHRPLDSYARSVDEIETITGIDFFAKLPDNIEEKVEAACSPSDWGL